MLPSTLLVECILGRVLKGFFIRPEKVFGALGIVGKQKYENYRYTRRVPSSYRWGYGPAAPISGLINI